MLGYLLKSRTGDIPNVDAEVHTFTVALSKLAVGVHSYKSQSPLPPGQYDLDSPPSLPACCERPTPLWSVLKQLDVCLANLEYSDPITKASISLCKDDVSWVDLGDRKQMRVIWR
jgi:hypothetical protein